MKFILLAFAIAFFPCGLTALDIQVFKKLAEGGDKSAQSNLGLIYYNGEGVPKDNKEALKWFKMSADQGDAVGQFNLGVMYYNGEAVRKDNKEAVKWYLKAAEQGEAMAQANLGVMYMNGTGVTQDYKEAVKWFKMSIEQGEAVAQTNLGLMYANGKGVPQDYSEAFNWFRIAALQGNAMAQSNLGVLIANGKGVPKDYIKAYAWLYIAKFNGQKLAEEILNILKSILTEEQIADSLSLSREIYRQIEANKIALSVQQGNDSLGANEIVISVQQGNTSEESNKIALSVRQGNVSSQNNQGNINHNGTGMSQEDEEGKREGLVVGWYRNGKKNWEGNFKDGKEDGLFISWYENGAKKSEKNWKDGKQDGLATEWYASGIKKVEGTWKDGKQEGLITHWHENAIRKSEVYFSKNEKRGTCKHWFSNGKLKLIHMHLPHNGNLNGQETYWFDNGQKKLEINYKDGKEDGPSTTWYFNDGKKEMEVNFRDGKPDGLLTGYYENGQKSAEVNFDFGKIITVISWKPNGDLCPVTDVKDGNGIAVSYNMDGSEEKRERVKDGKRIEGEERRLAANRAEEEGKQKARSELIHVRDTNAAYAKLGDSFTISDLGLEMIWVKAGTFMMGSPLSEADRVQEETQHQVTLTLGFYLGKYEVTQAQWERVMGNNPSHFKGADRPVEKVSWTEAVEFCKKLTKSEKKVGRLPLGMSYQLPTEAQWEYACRAGTSTMYSWGDSISSSNANYDGNIKATTSAGKYPANPWGFHDVHGNVWEWCSVFHGEYPSGPVTDPSGPVTDPVGSVSGWYRVFRGGSWGASGGSLRSAQRYHNFTSIIRYNYLGFRVGLQSSK